MSTNRIDDPALRAIEDQLAGLTPQVSSSEQQDLLYRCAFAAGRQTMTRSLRRWQGAVATLAVLVVGLTLPLASSPWMVAQHEVQPQPAAQPQIATVERAPELIRPVVPAGQLDAWQVTISSSEAVASNLEQLAHVDPQTRPLAVAAMTRAALQQ